MPFHCNINYQAAIDTELYLLQPDNFGATGENRTHNPVITSDVLYH